MAGGNSVNRVAKWNNVAGVEDNFESNSFYVYPNPATNELIIENGELKIENVELYNSIGEKVFSQPQTTNHKLQTVEVSQLSPGIYFITLTDQAGNKVTKKVVKM